MKDLYDSRWQGLQPYKDAFTSQHRQETQRIAQASRRAALRLAGRAAFGGIETEHGSTLPLADHQPEKVPAKDDVTNNKRTPHKFERDGRAWLGRLRESYAPAAQLLRMIEPETSRQYYRLTALGEDQKPAWAIAERDDNGNATYVWRRDLSPVDADTAFATTRGTAIRYGCIRIPHAPGFGDTDTAAAAAERHMEKVADILTKPAEEILRPTQTIGAIALRTAA